MEENREKTVEKNKTVKRKTYKFVQMINSKKTKQKTKNRMYIFICIVLICLLFLSIRMILINRENQDKYAKKVFDNLKYKNTTILSKRGDITDRTGTVLAYSEKVYNLILDPNTYWDDKTNKEKNINILVENFNLDRQELLQIFNEYEGVNCAYKRIVRHIPHNDVQGYVDAKSKDKEINSSWLEEEYIRTYPYNNLAASVLGYATETTGVIGIEKYYNSYLTGINGREYGYVDKDLDLETTIKPAINGSTLVLTIDSNVQRIVERNLREFNEEFGSKHSACIIMNPDNGEILAMAQYPTFDLNNPSDLSSYYTQEEIDAMDNDEMVDALYDIWSNFCVSTIYEPGSVFKAFTIATGLEEGVLDGTEEYYCDGSQEVMGVKINCAHTEGHGTLTLSQALEESCNDALIQIVAGIGKEKFSTYVNRFGFGRKTNIDLPAEEFGLTYQVDKMSDIDLATNSFGQNLNVTMVQEAAAFCSLINGGHYYQPHMVKRIESTSGETLLDNEGILVRQTISKDTSKIISSYLKNVVDYGTGGYLKIDGYSIGGKTGAAEKQPRDKKHYVTSFIGFMPVEDPKVVFYVVLDEADVEDYDSSRTAQLVARDIMIDLIPYLEIYPDDEKYEINVDGIPQPEEETTQDEQTPEMTQTTENQLGENTENQPEEDVTDVDNTNPDTESTENSIE